ncbi:uncharacterized protein [Nicotiana sylvestris]|uniref:uncharacterized protein n=1 Tax=Nicotiana sylvestris TaxID=4096 RepID=UPI00388CDE12
MAEELKKLTSRVQSIEGDRGIEGLNYEYLFKHPDVELPERYKPPKFEMFDGIDDPRVHLRTYYDKLVGVGKDEKIRMKLFMRSLTGDTLSWYISQNPKKWSNWVSMASNFLDQFNTENAPDAFYIQNLKKKPTETFHEHATHWRSEATKVRPALDEELLNKFFVRAQDPQYYERLMVIENHKFSDIIKLGEGIEEGIKSGMVTNFEALQAMNKALQSGDIPKKKGVGTVMVAHCLKSPFSLPTRQNYPRPSHNFDRKPLRQYTAIAEPIDQLYERLKTTGYVTLVPAVVLENPSQRINPNKIYVYHSGMKGYTTAECRTLKDRIQTLIDNKVIQAKEATANVHNSPLPDHRGDSVHVVETNKEWDPEGSIEHIREGDDFKVVVTLTPIVVQTQKPIDVEDYVAAAQRKRKTKIEESDATQGMTRTGRVYTPEHLGGSRKVATTRQPVIKTGPNYLWRKEHAKEYSIIDHLNKVPAQISILLLLQNSEAHKNALIKVLSEAYVPDNNTSGEMANMVGQVLESHKIIFHEDELPPEGLSQNRVLHITVQYEDKFIARVLVDGGSSLNICPLDTLKRLDKGFHEIRTRSMNVKGFDGLQRATIGEINLYL